MSTSIVLKLQKTWFGQRENGSTLISFKTLHSSKWKSKSSRLVSWISTRKASFSLKLGRLKFPSQQSSSWRWGLVFYNCFSSLLAGFAWKPSERIKNKREYPWYCNYQFSLFPPVVDGEGKVWFYNPQCTAVWSSKGHPRPPPWSHKQSTWVNFLKKKAHA